MSQLKQLESWLVQAAWCLVRKWWCPVPRGWLRWGKKKHWTLCDCPQQLTTLASNTRRDFPDYDLRGKKSSNCHECNTLNTRRLMTSWKAHYLQLYVKAISTHFPVNKANCHPNQETDPNYPYTIKADILKPFFTFTNTKASSRTENQCEMRKRMKVSCFCNQIFCLQNTALGSINKKKQWKWFITQTLFL